MNELDFLVMVAASAVAYGHFCRLNALRFREHRAAVVVFHLVQFGGCFWTGIDAWRGELSIAHGCLIVAAALWLVISMPTWRDGPPDHVSSGFGALVEAPRRE